MKIQTFDGVEKELTPLQEQALKKGAEYCLAKCMYWQREYSELLERKVDATNENEKLKKEIKEASELIDELEEFIGELKK